jgi:hypothetical protein
MSIPGAAANLPQAPAAEQHSSRDAAIALIQITFLLMEQPTHRRL